MKEDYSAKCRTLKIEGKKVETSPQPRGEYTDLSAQELVDRNLKGEGSLPAMEGHAR